MRARLDDEKNHLSHGFYEISEEDAKELARKARSRVSAAEKSPMRRAPGDRTMLPSAGYELVVEYDGKLWWLARTPHRNRLVWSIREKERPDRILEAMRQDASRRNAGADPLDPLVVADLECLDGAAPGGGDVWRKRASAAEIMSQIAPLELPAEWVAFLGEVVRSRAVPIDAATVERAGFRRVGRNSRALTAGGYQAWVEGWGESCLLEGLYEGEPPGSGDGRLDAYIQEQSDRKRLLPFGDPDAVPDGARRWVLSLWLPAAENGENHEVVSVDLWEGVS